MGAGTGGDPEKKHIWLRGEKKKRIEDSWVCLRRVLIVRLSSQNETSYAFMRIKYKWRKKRRNWEIREKGAANTKDIGFKVMLF